jgi:uncharacterized membrane protein
MSSRFRRSPVVRYALHTFDQSMMFIILAIVAFSLAALVKFVERAGAPTFLVYVFTFLEYAIVIVDALVFLFRLAKSAWATLKDNES